MIKLKKKIIGLTTAFMLFAGVVSASSIHGDYKGNPIVKVTTGGIFAPEEVVTEIPAIMYEGTTMLPIEALKEIGASVSFDEEKQTVRINVPKKATNPNMDLLNMSGVLSKNNSVSHIEFLAKAEDFTRITLYYEGSFLDEKYLSKDFLDILFWGTLSDAVVIQIEDKNKSVMWAYSNYAYDFVNEKITYDEFKPNLHVSVSTTPPLPITAPTISRNVPSIYSNDGKIFLGKLTTNEIDPDSIFNEIGKYGSDISSTSIWNNIGEYGSTISAESAFNDIASSPPIIVLNGKIIGYLTTNTIKTGAVSPYGLKNWLQDLGY